MHLAKVDKKAKAKKEKKQKEDKEKQDRKDNKAKRDLEKLEKNALDAKQEAQDEADANAASAAAADMTEEQRAAAREEVLAKLETPLEKMKIKQLLGLLEERGRPCLKCKGAEKSHIVSQVCNTLATRALHILAPTHPRSLISFILVTNITDPHSQPQ